ncbi:MAG: hypothetical protein XD95_0050 [Microgenomates bacterium 39_7]|nr:MAG: hypothetical protein XD95_0050 [Microgenomates bacterium 39_7]
MQEHPIPQDITGYKFHLVGSMTLKQFAEVLVGVLVALVFHKSGLPAIIRWPAMIFSAGLGAMAAFVPIEERPLDHWIVTFIKVLFKPTKFFWKREPSIPDAFLYETQELSAPQTLEVDLSPARKNKIYQYLQSISHPIEEIDDYDQAEQQRVNQLLSGFEKVSVVSNPTKDKTKPNLTVRVREMRDLELYSSTQISNQPSKNAQQNFPTNPPQTSSTNRGEGGALSKDLSEVSDETEQKKIGQNNPPNHPKPPAPTTIVNTLPPPTNSLPNQISGILLSSDGKLISGAVIEIKDENNKTVTAVKSNSLGQFVVSRQLPDGNYTLAISAEGFQFEPIQTTLVGELVGSLEIKASG